MYENSQWLFAYDHCRVCDWTARQLAAVYSYGSKSRSKFFNSLVDEVGVSAHEPLECDILWMGRYCGFIHYIVHAADRPFPGFVDVGLTGVAVRCEAVAR